jgi:hypothetical protein
MIIKYTHFMIINPLKYHTGLQDCFNWCLLFSLMQIIINFDGWIYETN